MCSENSTSSCPSQGLSLCFSLKHFVVDSLGTIGESKVRQSSLKSVAPRCRGTREAGNVAQECRTSLPGTKKVGNVAQGCRAALSWNEKG